MPKQVVHTLCSVGVVSWLPVLWTLMLTHECGYRDVLGCAVCNGGGWAGGGMAGADSSTAGRLARMGMPLITPAQGLAALSSILSSQSGCPVISAVPFEWAQFLQHGQNSTAPIFADFALQLPNRQPEATQLAALPSAQQSHTVFSITAAEQSEVVGAAVHSTISSVLGSTVGSSAPLMAAGLDSLGTVELRNALQTKLGLQLPSTLVFDYPTANDITTYIVQQLVATTGSLAKDVQASTDAAAILVSSQQPVSAQTRVGLADVTLMVQEVAGGVLGVTPAADTPLMAAGLDSLGMVEVRNALQSRLGLQLPSTLLFDYPSIDAISIYISQQLAIQPPGAPEAAQALLTHHPSMLSMPQQDRAQTQAMLVTAMVTAAPQGALQSTAAVDTISAVPLSRWDVDAAPEGLFTGPAVKFGSYLSNPAAFDAAAFGTSETEAMYMDPQQRLLLQAVAQALASCEFGGGSFLPRSGDKAASSMGVFVGVSSSDYEKLVMRHTRGVTAYTATGRAASVASGRLSYTFGLKGPSLTVDTACSSSLVSLHMAHNSLLLGQCTAVCNSGVNIMISPETPAAFQKAGMLSADGRCKTMDSSADGYVRAEACGSMVVQLAGEVTSSAAVAVFRGSAVNQDGRSSSLTAPNGPSQQGVIRQALQASALEPHHIHALQLHGTGESQLLQHGMQCNRPCSSVRQVYDHHFTNAINGYVMHDPLLLGKLHKVCGAKLMGVPKHSSAQAECGYWRCAATIRTNHKCLQAHHWAIQLSLEQLLRSS